MDLQTWLTFNTGATYPAFRTASRVPVKRTDNAYCQLVLAGAKAQRVELLVEEEVEDGTGSKFK